MFINPESMDERLLLTTCRRAVSVLWNGRKPD